MSDIVIHRPAAPSVVTELAPIVQAAHAFAVTSETHEEALHRIRRLRLGERGLTEHFEPARKAADDAKKAILTARDGLVKPMATARAVYEAKEQAYATIEQQRLEAVAREQAERQRHEEQSAIAERARVERERLAAEAAAAREEGDIATARAAEARSKAIGAAARADVAELKAQPIVVDVEDIPGVGGISKSSRWSAKIGNAAEFLRWLAAHPEEVDMQQRAAAACVVGLNRMATSQRASMAIPGVMAIESTSLVVRRAGAPENLSDDDVVRF